LQRPTAPHERHPAWILGHLLLAGTYRLLLLAVEPLPDDFPLLVERFGPGLSRPFTKVMLPAWEIGPRLNTKNIAPHGGLSESIENLGNVGPSTKLSLNAAEGSASSVR
jgi:hypothetical protein